MSIKVALVVPCFNEESRLDLARFDELLRHDDVRLVFVDDGSRDRTLSMLRRFVDERPERADIVVLPRNGGKGEAVRAGLRRAISDGARFVGYADADLATPPSELLRLVDLALRGDFDVVMGSRIARAGAQIERRATRHYLGRFFATYASLLLGATLYDTQCGAKILRATPTLSRALEGPFVSRWVFDVELLGRLVFDASSPLRSSRILEVPLEAWRDVHGSHIRASALPTIAADIAKATGHVLAMRNRAS